MCLRNSYCSCVVLIKGEACRVYAYKLKRSTTCISRDYLWRLVEMIKKPNGTRMWSSAVSVYQSLSNTISVAWVHARSYMYVIYVADGKRSMFVVYLLEPRVNYLFITAPLNRICMNIDSDFDSKCFKNLWWAIKEGGHSVASKSSI